MLEKWLFNLKFIRYVFFIFLSMSIVFSLAFDNNNFFVFYHITLILLGISFYNKPILWVVFTLLVSACRFHFVPHAGSKLLLYFVSYLCITFISATLMTYVQRVNKRSLDLIISLSKALDYRDPYTFDHSENVAKYAVQIAEKMNLSSEQCEIVRLGGLLHDIGKIGISENILTKPGKLTEDEYNMIKNHPTFGFEMLKNNEHFKKDGILDIVLYHHERYDGKGYPTGLKGTDIPLYARIVAVADTFDAMTSRRVYRNELHLEDSLKVIRQNKGTQFDPEVVDAFLINFANKI